MPHGGKERSEFMEDVVYRSLGMKSEEVLVGPGKGLDNAVVSVGGRRVMIITVDPVSAMPSLGMRTSAWLSVHLVASDFVTSGVDPQFAIFAYNFPPAMTPLQREEYVSSIGDECRRLGIAIAAGHTGSYPGGEFTVIGSGAMLGTAAEDGYVTPAMARDGDAVLMTKHAAIEATATLSATFPGILGRAVGDGQVRRAKRMRRLCTTVEDARAARKAGLGDRGVTSMHDATEGGVIGALEEMSRASGKAFVVEQARIPVSKESEAVCAAFKIDPLRTMGEGALLVTCSPGAVRKVERALSDAAIPVARIGAVTRGEGLWLETGLGKSRAVVPARDPFWGAYDRASRLEPG